MPAAPVLSPSSGRDRLILGIVFLLSGASALLFETLWLHLAGLVFGVSVYASALVLSSFMGGLALGNALISRFGRDVLDPVRFYAAMELLVGVWGLLLVLCFPMLSVWLGAMLSPALNKPFLLNTLRFSFSFLLFLLPATAMGATLPLLVKALTRRPGEFGRVLGRLYGVNTLGACLGALAGETLLIAPLGLSGTGMVAAGLNVLAAAGAIGVSRRFREEPVREDASGQRPEIRPLTNRAKRLLAAGFLAGGAFLALEVVWTRFLQLFVRSTSLAFAVMLAVILAGIGLGGVFAGWWLRREADGRRITAPLVLLVGASALLSFRLFESAADLSFSVYQTLDWRYMTVLSLTLMFPAAFISGMVFTTLGEAFHREVGDRARSAGLVAMANTLGAMAGPLVAGFVLIPAVGMELSLFILCALYILPALLCAGRSGPWPSPRTSRFLLASGFAFVLFLAIFPFGAMRGYLNRACADFIKDGEKVVATIEGVTGTLQYLRQDYLGEPYAYRLVTDGYSMSSTDRSAKRYMKLFGYFPEATLQNPKSALLICFGTGSTASALVEDRRLSSIDVVDISRDVLRGASIVYPKPERNPLEDPRVATHVEDGRFYLLAAPKKYDIITAEPPPPMMAGVVNLYSREYFQLMRDRLNDGGMVTYWLPVFEISPADAKAILKAFSEVFEHTSLWTGDNFNWMMVGVKKPKGPKPAEDFSRPWEAPGTGPGLRHIAVEKPGQLGALFMLDGKALADYLGDAKPLTDNYPKRLRGYPESPQMQQQYLAAHNKLLDALAAKERFEHSAEAALLLPQEIREKADGWFETQQIMNTYLNNMLTPPPPLPAVNYILSGTDLRVLPLWLMKSDAKKQAIVARVLEQGAEPTAETEFQLGIKALADRDYLLADAKLKRAQEMGYPSNLAPARVYVLCMAGLLSEAEDLAGRAFQTAKATAGARRYMEWLAQTFGFKSPF
ncbi:Spermine synthase [Solidesulfovibrio fructosivorans JJ]]|uniref:Spermine synthase n=1 Tax=Solidesulfovibrio fructosivorans JJ] TaxID=596151 RepID=E1JYU1_SOLFR|nr:fused MFS/spermidine synthase [Solidesulfovibrio fructosivorans]EFL50511.1 Spermine synthase [Solidesulfovibrio fructosivorans JJ]]